MNAVFLKLLNMSIAASWLVLAVIILRCLLKKAPKWISCLLWSIVALRLAMPVSFESIFSLIPSAEVIPLDVAVTQTPAIYSGIPAVNSVINPLFTLYFPSEGNGLERILFFASIVWLTGMVVMLLYSTVAYIKLWRQVKISLPYRDNIYICDNVDSPFLLGIFRARIYVPSGMAEEHMQFVLAHENAHIKRRDHWWKPLGFLFLTVYWFNPLLWVAYILLCRDVERACDEKVIAGMDPAGKIGYSAALAACSVHRRMVMACPVAFGEVGVKDRIKGVLNYKKPAFWIVSASVAMCVITAVCFLTNPKPCAHTYQGEITTDATCTEKGIQTRVCTLCQHIYTVPVDLLAHTYDTGIVTQEPTCTHLGSRLLECVYCGSQKTEIVEKTDHIAAEPVFVKAPNCTEKGERSVTCAYCHTVYVAEIFQPNDDHDLKETVLREATCASPGEGVYACTRCDYSESCSYEQLEHHYTRREEVAATCQRSGLDSFVCTGCGDSYLVTTGVIGHNWKGTGRGYSVCTVCGMHGAENYSLLGDDDKKQEDLFPSIRIWP